MALVKVKPTSPGRRALVKVVDAATCTRASRTGVAARAARARHAAATTTATSRCATRAAATSTTTASSTSGATRTASPAKVERIEYDPNRSAHLALLLYADGERRYIIAPQGRRRSARSSCRAPKRRSSRATRCRCATSRSARRSTASRCCRARARRSRARPAPACSCWRAKASTRSCACARAKSARCTSTAAPPSAKSATKSTTCESIGKAGAKRWRGIRPTVRGVAMNPVDHPHGGGEGRTAAGQPPVSPWGTLTKGYKTRSNKRTQIDDRPRRRKK